jgi:hypothetical protein
MFDLFLPWLRRPATTPPRILFPIERHPLTYREDDMNSQPFAEGHCPDLAAGLGRTRDAHYAQSLGRSDSATKPQRRPLPASLPGRRIAQTCCVVLHVAVRGWGQVSQNWT